MSLHVGSSAGTTSVSAAAYPLLAPNGAVGAPSYAFSTAASTGMYTDGTNILFACGGAQVVAFGPATTTLQGSLTLLDTIMIRDAANIIAVKNGATAQTFRVYGSTTGPKYASVAHDGTNMVLSEVGGGNVNISTADVAAATAIVAHVATSTIAGAVTDGFTAGLRLTPTVNAGTALTMTRLNYIDVNTPTLGGAGPAAVTDAAVFRFNAAAGTHKAVDSGTTKTSPGTVTQWVKINVNGTLGYIPSYSSKTS